MRLPSFNPRDVPCHPLSEVLGVSNLSKPMLTREILNRALTLSIETIDEHILRQDVFIEPSKLQPAAVLLLLVESAHGFDVVLTVRAFHLRHHAGQVSFVGGRMDEGETPEQAALREAYEEIGLLADDVEILGRLPEYHTITGFAVTPVLGLISEQAWAEQNLSVAVDEVSEVFTVPLAHVLDVQNTNVHQYDWEGMSRQYYSVQYGEYFIWGASMAILRNLATLLHQAQS
ncbi:NUDIX hydrolase [Hydromonas duriensis]|uniref:NUDIX domain-containing protein n=1 Tax=Hydromonas duriensis TaxID=1527608 RepID=A0A4R6YC18_9BURK|nr:CoA pyrophosphatase [Hydromonas duriensis]TDR33169.1 NUDIX domain-containing protein [Hydromonas duriensis]